MKNPTSRLLFAYWDALRRDRRAPERAEIEPGEIRHLLADMFILEVAPGGSAAFRLAGTRLCALFGRELTGSSFGALWGPRRQDAAGLVEAVTQDGAGAVAGLLGATSNGHEAPLELLLLPLRHRGRTSLRVLGAVSPGVVPVWIGFEPVAKLTTTSVRILWPTELPAPAEAADSQTTALERRSRLVVVDGGLISS